MKIFFNDEKFKDSVSTYLKVINKQPASNQFEETRNKYIELVLRKMVTDAVDWDERTQFNIGFISEALRKRISETDMSKESVDTVYSMLLRFFTEEYLNNPVDEDSYYQDIRDFSLQHLGVFSERVSSQIHYAMYDMSTSMFRSFLNSDQLAAFRKLGDVKESTEKLQEKWRSEIESQRQKVEETKFKWKSDLNETEERVRQLQETLTNQRNAFNFVGLYHGFESLGEIKKNQLFWARLILVGLGLLIPGIIVFESLFFYFGNKELKSMYDLASLFPAASLTLILIYYFRVSLGNYNSIRAQIMQIDLRKSLCQFIQNYAEYSSGIKAKDGNLLAKFEDIIFSNIMSSEDKIPSTFDGVEQVASLITALKGK